MKSKTNVFLAVDKRNSFKKNAQDYIKIFALSISLLMLNTKLSKVVTFT